MLSIINRDLAKSRIHRLSITKMFGIPVIVEICWNRLVVKLKNVRLECGNEQIVFNVSIIGAPSVLCRLACTHAIFPIISKK